MEVVCLIVCLSVTYLVIWLYRLVSWWLVGRMLLTGSYRRFRRTNYPSSEIPNLRTVVHTGQRYH